MARKDASEVGRRLGSGMRVTPSRLLAFGPSPELSSTCEMRATHFGCRRKVWTKKIFGPLHKRDHSPTDCQCPLSSTRKLMMSITTKAFLFLRKLLPSLTQQIVFLTSSASFLSERAGRQALCLDHANKSEMYFASHIGCLVPIHHNSLVRKSELYHHGDS